MTPGLVKVLSAIIAIATLLTEIALIAGFVWSIVAHTPVILPVVLALLAAGFGVFVYRDGQKYFGKKTQ